MPKLTLVPTPIGNLRDISPRCEEAMRTAQTWFVEDSRVSGKLQSHLGIKCPMRIVNEHTSEGAIEKYLSGLEPDADVILLTDAGTPGISDPGAIFVEMAYAKGFEIDALPGPSAVMNALMLSGFFAQRFAFLGYLARKPGAIKSDFLPFVDSSLTIVLFESPFRVDATLALAHEVLGPRRFAITRELTKMHQQVVRGILPNLPTEQEMLRKGEFTLVLEGHRKRREL
jgi:16S rRNA (cytidine1402-2'-O)-methyltransferase